MSRSSPEAQRISSAVSPRKPDPGSETQGNRSSSSPLKILEFWLVRLFIIGSTTALCYKVAPFGLHGFSAAGVGFLLAFFVVLAELRLRRAAFTGLLGGTLGTVLGMVAALLVTLVISRTGESDSTKTFLEYASLFAFAYLGLVLGSQRGGELNANALGGFISSKSSKKGSYKLLDTSVLIDGRIADICEAEFLEGVLAVPQFVLHELQLVADSADGLKRQRGRRGLEVLQRLQKLPQVEVRVIEKDLPQSGPVDDKLLELAQQLDAKVVTNDFNLSKVAAVQGIAILNVNQLANALKPVVLPGESRRVLILREGKEPRQGIAFLDDGTMVVVDNARPFVNKRVDILVTSVHQTTAGKMIFGRLDDQTPDARQDLRGDSPGVLARGATGSGMPASAEGGPMERRRVGDTPQPIFPEHDAPDAG